MEEQAPRQTLIAAFWLLLSGIFFTGTGVAVKMLGQSLHAFEISFFRVVVSMLVITPFLIRAGRSAGGVRTQVPWLQVCRGIAGSTAMLAGFYAIVHLPLADAQALSFSRTLFVVPLAALILSETVGVRRWMAVLVGFMGVIIMLRPGQGIELSVGMAAALAHAFLVAIATILVSLVSRYDRPVTLMFYTNIVGLVVTGIPTLYVWQMPTDMQWVWLLVMGVFATAAHNCFIRAYALGEASAIAPVDYMRLFWAAIAGYLVFDTLPDLYGIIGAAVISLTTLYIVRREASLGRKPQA